MQIQNAKKKTPKVSQKKMQKVIRYKAAVSVFKKWLEYGYIRQEDFVMIDAAAAEKYGLPPNSIYRNELSFTVA